MRKLNYLFVEINSEQVATITLDRPDMHNAFNDELIVEFVSLLKELKQDENLRLLVLRANGKSFCAGADLNWMSKMSTYSFDENVKDANGLAELFYELNSMPMPVLLKLHGHALGGGAGLVACADEVIALDSAELGFTEVRLGLIPAVISPFVIHKIGESHARATFLSGRRIKMNEAFKMGLVHEVCSAENFDQVFDDRVKLYLETAPKAARVAKDLIKQISHPAGYTTMDDKRKYTTELIAHQRVSEVGQEGMKSLLNKTKPNWMK